MELLKILMIHIEIQLNFGDSTAILDSSAASHNYKAPGNHEVKLSMVATTIQRIDFQNVLLKCNGLNKKIT
jgi:hypothetical protein